MNQESSSARPLAMYENGGVPIRIGARFISRTRAVEHGPGDPAGQGRFGAALELADETEVGSGHAGSLPASRSGE